MAQLRKILKNVWHYLQEACGENDYARYRARAIRQGDVPLPHREFYLSQLRQKYSRINRCC